MRKELAVEPYHPLVLVPFDKYGSRSAAYPKMVGHPRAGDEKHLPVFLPETHAPIEIFAVHEVPFVELANII